MIGRLLYPLGVALLLGACQDATGVQGPPPAFSSDVQAHFEQYLAEVNPTLFVVSADGQNARYTYCPQYADACAALGGVTKSKALKKCEESSRGVPCKVYAVGRRIVWEGGSAVARSPADADVCTLALSSYFQPPHWNDQDAFREFVDKAKRRGFTPYSCANLLGWENASSVVPSSEDTDIEARLERLKGLYDQGLITKEEYDKKRAEILEVL